MAETLDNSMGDFIARFIQRLSKDPAFQNNTPEEIKAEALKRIREAEARRTDAKNKEVSDRRAKKSKEWADKVKSKDGKIHQEALTEAEKAKYADGLTLNSAREHLAQTESVVNAQAPTWLKTDIKECPQVVELIARVTQLSPELQNDPNVLYLELAKLNKSMKWSEASPEARKEARIVMDKVLAHISEKASEDQTFGDASRDVLLESVDPDRVHLRTITDIESAGDEPDKSDKKKYAKWVSDKIKEEQARNLQHAVDFDQGVFDLPENQSAENQRKLLEKFVENLSNGSKRSQRLNGVEGYHLAFDSSNTLSYIESAQARINQLNSIIDQHELYAHEQRAIDAGRMIRWDKRLEGIYKHHDHKTNETYEFGNRLSKQDIDEIVYGGIAGQRKWLARFREKWIGATGAPFQPGLTAQMEFDEFRRLATWLNGVDQIALAQRYDDLWHLYEDVDSIIKGTLNRPAGQKSEESFNVLRYFQNTHHEFLRQYEMVDIAKPAVSEAIEDVLRDEMSFYLKTLDDLCTPIMYEGKQMRRVDKFLALRDKYTYQKAYKEMLELRENKGTLHREYHDEDGHPVLGNNGRPLTNEQRLQDLEASFVGKSEQYGGMTQVEYDEMQEIEVMIDVIGHGVLLRDYQMMPHQGAYIKLTDKYNEYMKTIWDLNPQESRVSLSQADKTLKEGRRDALLAEMQKDWIEFTQNKNAVFDPNTDGGLLAELRNFSPVQIRAYDRVVQTLRSDWLNTHPSLDTLDRIKVTEPGLTPNFHGFLQQESYKIRDAVWAAQTIVVGTGEAMEKGGKLGRSAMFDLQFTLGLPGEIKTKHFMDRGFLEKYQRVVNPYIFEEDFHMGSKLGEAARDLNYEIAFNEVGYDYKKDPSMPKEWKDKVKSAQKRNLFADAEHKVPIPVWVVYTQYGQEVLGMSFDQALRPDLLATGLQSLSTYWRMQKYAYEPIIKDYLKTKRPGESPEYQGMGMALASLSESNIAARMPIVRRTLERKPSIFIKLLGKDLEVILQSENLRPGTSEWKSFQDTLALMEMELWRNPQYTNKPYDLTDKASFIDLAKRSLAAVNPRLAPQGVTSQSEAYFNVIDKMQHYLRSESVNGKTRLENWASHKIDKLLILSTSDFNWQKTDFSNLGFYALERRINDFQAQKRAEEHRRDILIKKEFLSPSHDKEAELIEKLKAFHDEVINYAGDDTSEVATSALLRTVIEFNRNRAVHTFMGWIPGAVSIMKRMNLINENFEVMLENWPKWLSKPINKFMEETKLAGRPLNKWPRSISDAVSLAVGWGGPEANAWNEKRIGGLLEEAEKSMMFIKLPKKLARMKRMYKTLLGNRLLAVAREYWWVVPVATIAVALMGEVEEEKKRRR